MKIYKKWLVVVIAMLCLVSSTSAALIVQTQPFPAAGQSTAVPYSATLTFNQFNPTLGTLTSVGITINTVFNASVSVINMTPSAQHIVNATAIIPITLIGPYALNNTVTVTAGPFIENVPSSLPTWSTYQYAGLTSILDTKYININSGDFPAFTGSGTTPFDVQLLSNPGTYSGTSLPGVFFGGLGNANGSVVISYVYTAVPEAPTYIAGAFMLLPFFYGIVKSRNSCKA